MNDHHAVAALFELQRGLGYAHICLKADENDRGTTEAGNCLKDFWIVGRGKGNLGQNLRVGRQNFTNPGRGPSVSTRIFFGDDNRDAQPRSHAHQPGAPGQDSLELFTVNVTSIISVETILGVDDNDTRVFYVEKRHSFSKRVNG